MATSRTQPLNRSLSAAKAAKQDEFYTQYVDIQKDVEAYLEFDANTFRNKIVYCNCDDPFESNFFKSFAANFNKLGLKKLICTSYDGSPIAGQMTLFDEYNEGNGKRQRPKALCIILDQVTDEDGDGATQIFVVRVRYSIVLNPGRINSTHGRRPKHSLSVTSGLGKTFLGAPLHNSDWILNVKACKTHNAIRSA